MECHKNKNDKSCTPANWCVCQWAFRTYLEEAGGCDQIQDIQVSIYVVYRVNYRTLSYHVGILLQLICVLTLSSYLSLVRGCKQGGYHCIQEGYC